MGLPKIDIFSVNNKVKYDASRKIWICLICHKTNNKYNRKKIIGRVNTPRGECKSFKPNRKWKGRLVGMTNDIIQKSSMNTEELGRAENPMGK